MQNSVQGLGEREVVNNARHTGGPTTHLLVLGSWQRGLPDAKDLNLLHIIDALIVFNTPFCL